MKKSDMIKAMCDTFYENLEHNTMDYIMEAILMKQEELGMLPPNNKDKYDGSIFNWEEE